MGVTVTVFEGKATGSGAGLFLCVAGTQIQSNWQWGMARNGGLNAVPRLGRKGVIVIVWQPEVFKDQLASLHYLRQGRETACCKKASISCMWLRWNYLNVMQSGPCQHHGLLQALRFDDFKLPSGYIFLPYAGVLCAAAMLSTAGMVLSEKMDVLQLTFYTAPVSCAMLLPFYLLREVSHRTEPEHFVNIHLHF